MTTYSNLSSHAGDRRFHLQKNIQKTGKFCWSLWKAAWCGRWKGVIKSGINEVFGAGKNEALLSGTALVAAKL